MGDQILLIIRQALYTASAIDPLRVPSHCNPQHCCNTCDPDSKRPRCIANAKPTSAQQIRPALAHGEHRNKVSKLLSPIHMLNTDV
jgi:hypothetical protein